MMSLYTYFQNLGPAKCEDKKQNKQKKKMFLSEKDIFVFNLLFWKILDLEESCNNSAEFPYTLHLSSHNVNILPDHSTWSKPGR